VANVCELVAWANRHVPRPLTQWPAIAADFHGHDGALHPTGLCPGRQQLYQQAPPAPPLGWAPWNGVAYYQQSLVNSFSTIALQPPYNSDNDWVADSGASHHTTHPVGNISNPHPLNSASPSSIVVGNGSTLSVTIVGDLVIPGPFYLKNILLAPDIVQTLLSVRRFTTDNWCSMEFEPFGLSAKDLTTRNVISRSNSTCQLYTLRLPSSTASSLVFWLLSPRLHGTVSLATLALTPYLACLGHPLFLALVLLMILSYLSLGQTH
jgi:hypothetical protein